MGLLRQNMVEKATGTNALSLEVPAGESVLVKDIRHTLNAAGAEDLTVSIARKKVCQFKAPSGFYLLGGIQLSEIPPITDLFKAAGLFPQWPVAAGETITISAGAASSYLEMVYDAYDEGDQRAEMFNGSRSGSYRLFQMISNSSVLGAAGDLPLDQSDLDSAFAQFPGGDVVPTNTRAVLRGLFGAGVTTSTGGTNGQWTTFLKFLKDREEMFDRDLVGMNYLGNAADTSNAVVYSSVMSQLNVPRANDHGRIVVFDEPIIFGPGEELNIIATIGETGSAMDFVAGDVKLGLVIDFERIG